MQSRAIPPDSDVVYVGNTETTATVLRSLLERDVPIAEVVTLDPERAERFDVSSYEDPTPVAAAHDIPVYYPEAFGMDTAADRTHFGELAPDLVLVPGWQRLLPAEVLASAEHGALGAHGSAFGLPRGRGRSPLNWSLVEGLDRFVLSVFRLDDGPDSGAVVASRTFDVIDHDTIRTLYYKVAMSLRELYLDALGPVLRGEAEYEEQTGEATYYPKRTPDDGAIHWGDTTRDVHNLVRAVGRPYPGAFTEQDGRRVDVWRAQPFSSLFAVDDPPGRIVQTFEATGDFVVSTVDGSLLVTDWEADGWVPEEGATFDSPGDHRRVDRPEHRHNLTGTGGDRE
ncbi:methionyl-tRNA formyltransferase [Halomarina ordinaria]|uniref:Methionyl-tRNA formyltransferase n=1 Tax=Halomarina ordinaria TaxID=3033939 RepID=A0ABD5U9X8_9EURY|nr:methionyl-tRNA formyltransferase [Halomarina sp. PSRA2]